MGGSASDSEIPFKKHELPDIGNKDYIKKRREIDTYNSKMNMVQDLETRVIMSNLEVKYKSDILKKMKKMSIMDSFKYSSWVSNLLDIPFGKYSRHIIRSNQNIPAFLRKSMDILDSVIYKQHEAKKSMMDFCCKLISNKKSRGNVIALQSTPGTGKTKLIRQGLSKILNRPFHSINFGGLTDPSILSGHDYTYSGSMYGRITQILISSGVMDPIIYLDEIDKVGKGTKSSEIFGILTHVLDEEQNSHFTDNYFQGIPIDLSRVLFVVSYNNESDISSIVSDRFKTIKMKDLERIDKIYALDNYILDGVLSEIKMTRSDIIFSKDVLELIVDKNKSVSGMRQIKKMAQNIIDRVNYLNHLGKIKLPVSITKEMVYDLIEIDEEEYKTYNSIYN